MFRLSFGGGGLGPSLMDDEWIYGGRLEQIIRPWWRAGRTGCRRGAGRYPMSKLWQIGSGTVAGVQITKTAYRQSLEVSRR